MEVSRQARELILDASETRGHLVADIDKFPPDKTRDGIAFTRQPLLKVERRPPRP